MEPINQNFLATEKIGMLMRKYAIPCIISLLVGALYNIVDQIFIANASYLGSYGNVANAGKSMGNSIVMTLVAAVLLIVVYLVFDNGIIAMFGGTVNEETFAYSKEYFFWISVGIPFYMFGQAMNPIIRADGSQKFAMAAINNMIRKYSALHQIFGQTQYSQIPMAVVGIVMKFFQIVISIVVGAAGCIPIVGFNMGAGLKNRVNELFKKLLVAEAVESTVLSIIREIVFGVGFAILLPVFFGLDGVLYSMPLSDILTFVIALVLIVMTQKELNTK